jgi:hypothetical protein
VKKQPPTKFVDEGEYLLQFTDVYAVACPRCHKCAKVTVIDKAAWLLFAARRLTCRNCAYTAEWEGNSVKSRFSDEPKDWYFQLQFYFQTTCCGNKLWVFNRRHLEFLKKYVGAQLRSRSRGKKGWPTHSLASRMPKWLSAASHRKDVLVALTKLERALNMEEPI